MNWQGLLAALLFCTSLTGCLDSKSTRPSDWLDRFRQSAGPSGPNALFIEYALIERPMADLKLDKEIWADADEQVVEVEKRATVESNGYRVGRFGNVLPSSLQSMIANPQTDVGHRQRRLYFDSEFRLVVSKPVPKCDLLIPGLEAPDGGKTTFFDADFGILFTAKKDGEDKILLEFTPEIQSLDRKNGSYVIWAASKMSNKLTNLSWKISLNPDEHIIIGTSPLREDTVGYRSFAYGEGKEGRQRILLLKAGRMENEARQMSMGKDPSPRAASNSLVNQAVVSRRSNREE
ncbi:hypothetical protein KIH39_25650 [Telmatocola sphagniphila]|uniref:Uncharacterized protein n=1 Tax=Telmatocola sphagniphila TaxID=1123043 RepID=A0A8E6B858_9BACT|nr:hypothetical protein [Telmatocola sphagniphila]QVL32180.1 hypothetical protein KIH39_25650 [Telmatocola sphagniphila]